MRTSSLLRVAFATSVIQRRALVTALEEGRGAAVASTIADLRTPALVCVRSTLERNAERMRERAAVLGCELRPHMKTCKTVEAGHLATGGSRRRITVSTLAEAHFFAEAAFDDILYAVPLTADKVPEVLALHARLASFHVMIDHADQARALLAQLQQCAAASGASGAALLAKPLSVFVAVDCGYHRDGVDPLDESSVALVRMLATSGVTRFAGIYTHAGHSYDATTVDEVRRIADDERDVTVGFAGRLASCGLPCPSVGVGSTPTCSQPPDHLDGVDEMHPGNFLYYDTTQLALGSCTVDDIAVRVLTRVVGHYPKANTLLIDCGWTGASAQGRAAGFGGFPEHPQLRIHNLKQECGEVTSSDGSPLPYERYPIGSLLAIAPYHSCAATHQHQHVHILADDHATVLETWRICKGW